MKKGLAFSRVRSLPRLNGGGECAHHANYAGKKVFAKNRKWGEKGKKKKGKGNACIFCPAG